MLSYSTSTLPVIYITSSTYGQRVNGTGHDLIQTEVVAQSFVMFPDNGPLPHDYTCTVSILSTLGYRPKLVSQSSIIHFSSIFSDILSCRLAEMGIITALSYKVPNNINPWTHYTTEV